MVAQTRETMIKGYVTRFIHNNMGARELQPAEVKRSQFSDESREHMEKNILALYDKAKAIVPNEPVEKRNYINQDAQPITLLLTYHASGTIDLTAASIDQDELISDIRKEQLLKVANKQQEEEQKKRHIPRGLGWSRNTGPEASSGIREVSYPRSGGHSLD